MNDEDFVALMSLSPLFTAADFQVLESKQFWSIISYVMAWRREGKATN